MTGLNYSDDEIHRLLRQVLGEEKPAPAPPYRSRGRVRRLASGVNSHLTKF
jgi:hypothetical protein